MDPIKVIYSYAAQDYSAKEELERHLSVFVNSGLIETWSLDKIGAGEPTPTVLAQRFRSADIILLLVSPDYLHSESLLGEFEVAAYRHRQDVVALPVLVRPSQWRHTVMGQLCALPLGDIPISLWNNRDLAWLTVAEGVRRIAEAIRHVRLRREENLFPS